LRQLKRREGAAVQIVCSHDPREFESLAHRPFTQLPTNLAIASGHA
jgi:hypothetical protein